MKNRVILCIIMLYTICGNIFSQEKDTLLFGIMEEVLLTDIKSSGTLPWTFQKDTASDLDRFQNNVRNLFDRQPGVQSFNGENFAQDVRISIRGYGSRSAFGIRGIRLYQDGIPLTSPDGTTQMDEISVFDIAQVDIMRSSMAARLGNAAGGALAMRSNPFISGTIVNLRKNTLGSFDGGVRYGILKAGWKNIISINHHHFESKRSFSKASNTTLYNKTIISASKKWQIDLIQSAYYSPLGEDPGSLSLVEFASDRYQANARNVQFQSGESVQGLTTAVKSTYVQSDKSTWISSTFYRYRDFTGRLPFQNSGWIDLTRSFAGINNVYEYRNSNNNLFSLGQSIEYQADHRILSKNSNGVKEIVQADQNENVFNLGVYQQYQMTTSKFIVHQMFRYDFNRYSLRDFYILDGIQDGQTNNSTFNGSLGLGYKASSYINIFCNVNSAFEMPTLNELSNNPDQTGGFNRTLSPEKSVQMEAGLKLDIDKRFSLHASVFHIKLTDQIVGYELVSTPGRTYFRNAAKTIRNGVELNSDWYICQGINLQANYTYSHFVYKDFSSGASNFAENFQPLVPAHKINMGVSAECNKMIYAIFNLGYNSSMFLDDANKAKSNSFFEINGTLYSGENLSKKLTIGITSNNLFDLMNYSNFRVNAASQRFYEAASPMHFGIFVKLLFIRT